MEVWPQVHSVSKFGRNDNVGGERSEMEGNYGRIWFSSYNYKCILCSSEILCLVAASLWASILLWIKRTIGSSDRYPLHFTAYFSVCTVLVFIKNLSSYIVSVTGSSPVPTPGINGSAKNGLQEGEKKRKRKTLDIVEVQPKGTCKNL